MNNSDVAYWLALKLVPRLALPKKLALVDVFGLEGLFSTQADQLKHAGLTERQVQAIVQPDWPVIEKIILDCQRAGGSLIGYHSPFYPKLLHQIFDPPLVLFIKGNEELLNKPQIGIVGSRYASVNGSEVAFNLSKNLVESGLTVTSGLALGIDAAAHRGALESCSTDVSTIGVIATGIDQVYPARHRQLTQKIIDNNGAIITEFLPGVLPKAGHFPRRNRLISGLSLGVVVVEAALKSGSLITARCALEQNREVFAVPGAIYNPLSGGCHWLIKQGAKLIESAADIIEELDFSEITGLNNRESKKSDKKENQDLFIDPLLASVGYEITPVDLVISRSKLPIEDVLSRLTLLELRGLVSAVPGGYLRLNRG